MRASIFHLLALSSSILAQTPGFDPFSSPADQSKWNINDVLPIAWNATTTGGTLTLTLIGGSSSKDLAPVTVIAAHLNNAPGAPSTYAWPIPPNIGTFASYGVNLTLDDGSAFQYSAQFYINGGTGGGSTATVSQTSTGVVANSTTSMGTMSMSGNLTMSTPTTTSKSASVSASLTPAGTGSATGSGSGGATPSPTKNAGEGLRAGAVGLLGVGGAVMALML